MFHFIPSHDNSFYICKTCAQNLNKNQVPCQAVCNKLHIYVFPLQLMCIRRFERVFIARKLLFMKASIIPKANHLCLRGYVMFQ